MEENPYQSPETVDQLPRDPSKPSPIATCGCVFSIFIGALSLLGIGSLFGDVGADAGGIAAAALIVVLFLLSRWIKWRDAVRKKRGESS